tara:strand:+ start:376 stop:645 length:270 start_codon:yes stop_codon:yes gene_type:complete
MMSEVNFVSLNVSTEEMELFGFDDEPAVVLKDNWMLAHVMHVAGLFPSVTSARKNGWNKPIPNGFSEFTVGKGKKKVFILNEIIMSSAP